MKRSKSHPRNKQQWENIKHEVQTLLVSSKSHNPGTLQTFPLRQSYMELLKVQQGPGYFWFALFAVFKPWEHWEAPIPTAPYPSVMNICLHPDGFWTTALHTRDVVPPAVSVHHDIHVLSLCHSERHSENKNCAPHAMHDFASWAPRYLQNSQQGAWIVAPISP